MILTAAYDIDGGRAGVDDWQDSKLLALRLYMQASEANNSLKKDVQNSQMTVFQNPNRAPKPSLEIK